MIIVEVSANGHTFQDKIPDQKLISRCAVNRKDKDQYWLTVSSNCLDWDSAEGGTIEIYYAAS